MHFQPTYWLLDILYAIKNTPIKAIDIINLLMPIIIISVFSIIFGLQMNSLMQIKNNALSVLVTSVSVVMIYITLATISSYVSKPLREFRNRILNIFKVLLSWNWWMHDAIFQKKCALEGL